MAVESAVQTAVKTALIDEISFEEDDDGSTLFSNSNTLTFEEGSDESSASGSSLDSNTFTSSFLGSGDFPEDDSYSNEYSSGRDDSTLGTAATLDQLLVWAQSNIDGPNDIVLTFSEGLHSTRSVAIVSDAEDGEIELVDEAQDEEQDEAQDETQDEQASLSPSIISKLVAVKSVMSEENGYNQYEEQTTPLMEAFVFYIESTLEKMNKVKKAKRAATKRAKGKVDGNLSYVSEGLLQSFVKIMGKEEGNETGKSTRGGGRGLSSTEPVEEVKPVPKKSDDDWGDLVQTPTDDMVRSAFGLITTAISEEFDLPPKTPRR